MKKKVHVVHHTHWDFEWYFTNNESFIQFIYHLDEVLMALETNQIGYYLLDGQMSILDEYLQIFPEQIERIKRLVEAKQLFIGPWYTQTDELIVRGESMVRNLNLGMDSADALGGYMTIGYLPDSFGQSKDMPKIYQGFGIEKVVFWRGASTREREFIWVAEEGSKVLVSNIKNGYFVGVGLMYDAVNESLLEMVAQDSTSSELLLPVGGDQRFVDFDLRDRIALYNSELVDYELVESTYDAYFVAIAGNPLQTVSGEFIAGSVSKIHRSIYSSRYDHKYYHDKIERRMLYQLEPLMVLSDQLGLPYKKGVLDKIWKLLNKNQAHDSAGGCNSDKTNAHILERFKEADQLSYSLVDYLTRKLAESRKDAQEGDVVIFNPLPYVTEKIVCLELAVKEDMIALIDDTDQLIPFVGVKTAVENNAAIRRDTAKKDDDHNYYMHTVLAKVSIPAFSFKVYKCVTNHKHMSENIAVKTEASAIENEAYRLELRDDKLHVLDKKKATWIENILTIEDGGDEGDTYDYSPPYQDNVVCFDFAGAEVEIVASSLQSKMTLKGCWYVAKNLIERALGQRSAVIPYTATFILNTGEKQLQCKFEMDNKARDHRMRVLIQTPFFQNKHSYTDTPFGTIQRSVEDPHLEQWEELGWREEPTAIYPMLHYVNAHDATGSMTVFAKGIKEYQFVGRYFETIALTLFRSVGFLGRPDLLRRPGVASGNEFKYIPTPDSQLQKRLKFKFAIQLTDCYQPAEIMRDYLQYAVWLPYYQLQDLNRFTNTLKYFVSNKLPEKVHQKFTFALESEYLVLSTIVKTQEGTGFDVRIYNPHGTETVEGGIIRCSEHIHYEFVDLRGRPQTASRYGDIVELSVFKPGEIKTVHITL